MIVDTVDRQTIRAAVEHGSHAPSVPNSQPWAVAARWPQLAAASRPAAVAARHGRGRP
jgi:hypothetical protein